MFTCWDTVAVSTLVPSDGGALYHICLVMNLLKFITHQVSLSHSMRYIQSRFFFFFAYLTVIYWSSTQGFYITLLIKSNECAQKLSYLIEKQGAVYQFTFHFNFYFQFSKFSSAFVFYSTFYLVYVFGLGMKIIFDLPTQNVQNVIRENLIGNLVLPCVHMI